MNKFDLTEIFHMGQPASNPESVGISRLSETEKREMRPLVDGRLHTITGAMSLAAVHGGENFLHVLNSAVYNPQLQDPAMRPPQADVGHSALQMPSQEQAGQPREELIAPELAYATPDYSTVGSDPVREAEARARAAAASIQQPAPLAAEEDQAYWNVVEDAGIANPQVPEVVGYSNQLQTDFYDGQQPPAQNTQQDLPLDVQSIMSNINNIHDEMAGRA